MVEAALAGETGCRILPPTMSTRSCSCSPNPLVGSWLPFRVPRRPFQIDVQARGLPEAVRSECRTLDPIRLSAEVVLGVAGGTAQHVRVLPVCSDDQTARVRRQVGLEPRSAGLRRNRVRGLVLLSVADAVTDAAGLAARQFDRRAQRGDRLLESASSSRPTAASCWPRSSSVVAARPEFCTD